MKKIVLVAVLLACSASAFGQSASGSQHAADVIQASQKYQGCVQLWRIGVQAKSMYKSGLSSEFVIQKLIMTYGDGNTDADTASPDDKMLATIGAEMFLRHEITAGAVKSSDVSLDGPDYSSQTFLSGCRKFLVINH